MGERHLIPRDWDENAYGSHLFLLGDLMDGLAPRAILETGSGRYSTNFFLSRDIDRLVSIEPDPAWIILSGDPRHELIEGDPVSAALPPLDEFDLVFVDDDPVEARIDTLAAVLSQASCPVVLHDSDNRELVDLIDPDYRDDLQPQTAVFFPRPEGAE